MEEKIYNVLVEILLELKELNGKKKYNRKISDKEAIDLFVKYIVDYKYDGLSKSDLRAANIVSRDRFKHFIDYNIETISEIIREKYNILLSKAVPGYYIYKKYLNKYFLDS